jgi:two-component system response regulator YesN
MEGSPTTRGHVQRMLDLIQTTYADPVTLATLSTVIGRQPRYLGRLFRQEVGMTVHESLTRVRLQRAAELISEGAKVEAVALAVGYRSKKNFYIQFKRHFETTPDVYGRHRRAASMALSHPDAIGVGVGAEAAAGGAKLCT